MHHTRLLVKEDFPNIVLNIVTPDLEYKMSDAYCKNRNSRICLAKLISNINSRMYVQRLIQNPITVENTNELTDVINFIVDKKIILYGLQVNNLLFYIYRFDIIHFFYLFIYLFNYFFFF